jgi:hypothetical protein
MISDITAWTALAAVVLSPLTAFMVARLQGRIALRTMALRLHADVVLADRRESLLELRKAVAELQSTAQFIAVETVRGTDSEVISGRVQRLGELLWLTRMLLRMNWPELTGIETDLEGLLEATMTARTAADIERLGTLQKALSSRAGEVLNSQIERAHAIEPGFARPAAGSSRRIQRRLLLVVVPAALLAGLIYIAIARRPSSMNGRWDGTVAGAPGQLVVTIAVDQADRIAGTGFEIGAPGNRSFSVAGIVVADAVALTLQGPAGYEVFQGRRVGPMQIVGQIVGTGRASGIIFNRTSR